jgi:hypothetical protein
LSTLIEDIAAQTGLHPATVENVLGGVFAHMHRCFYEGQSVPINGDYVGEGLRWDIGAEGYYHFIGILVWLARNDIHNQPGELIEYALRGLSSDARERFQQQMDEWTPRVG